MYFCGSNFEIFKNVFFKKVSCKTEISRMYFLREQFSESSFENVFCERDIFKKYFLIKHF